MVNEQAPFLQAGDTIGIAATARKMNELSWESIVNLWQELGFKVKAASNLFLEDNQLAGNDAARARGFMDLWTDPEVKAVQVLRGGYGSARMADLLDDVQLQAHKKWLVGYSDVTVLHARLQKLGLQSLHATMPVNMLKEGDETRRSNLALRDALTGRTEVLEVHPESNNLAVSGELAGGNLSVLYSLLGSKDMPSLAGKILFLEDLDEYLYHIDRMMLSLYRSGFFKGVKAFVVGGCTEMKDNVVPFGKQAEEIIREYAEKLGIPAWFGLQAGHQSLNLPLFLGREYSLSDAGLGAL